MLHSNFVEEHNNVDYFKYGVYVIKKSQTVLSIKSQNNIKMDMYIVNALTICFIDLLY